MTRQQHLLVILMEECSEIAKRASKMIRFGTDDAHKGNEPNYKRLAYEYNDLLATMDLLQKEGIFKEIHKIVNYDAIALKIEKVEKYMKISKELGLLD